MYFQAVATLLSNKVRKNDKIIMIFYSRCGIIRETAGGIFKKNVVFLAFILTKSRTFYEINQGFSNTV